MNEVVTVFLVLGLIFFAGGTVGILRFPDFYSRLHPAGKLDTMGALLMTLAVALHNLHPLSWETVLTSLKVLLVAVLVFLTSPTATHAIVDAGVRAGLVPWSKGEPGRWPQ
jgi:multicomponent Na+:H+ antiporter subunit G